MTSTPERRRSLFLAAAALLAASAGAGADQPEAERYLVQAKAALAKSDGIAAEQALRKGMAAGLPREAVAARMGEALLDQDELKRAREWLVPGRFTPAEAPHGLRVLGRVEMADGNLPAAGRAFDMALALTPRDARLWTDIARLRYAGGQQLQAIEAVDKALSFDPVNIRALEFRGLIVRDSLGFTAALPWFEAGLKQRPDDLSLLGEYAATLGELGRAREMLTVTRRMIELDPHNPRAFFLQAVLAARAGNVPLARALLTRAGPDAVRVPAALLLQAVLELQAGNTHLAVELLDGLSHQQPQNTTVRLLLARALIADGNPREVVEAFAAEAQRPDASPYLQTLVGRAYEDLGQRDLAAPLLDRAAAPGTRPLVAIAEPVPIGVLALRYQDDPGAPRAVVPYVRALLAAGRSSEAADIAEKILAGSPGSTEAAALAGDLRMVRGNVAGAVEAWRIAAAVRLDDALMLRLVDAYRRVGRGADAERLVEGMLATRPRNRMGLRLAAGFAAERGDWSRASRLLDWLSRTGSNTDARLAADLAVARLREGAQPGALLAGEQAYALQRASGTSAEACGLALAAAGQSEDAKALLGKARAIRGEAPGGNTSRNVKAEKQETPRARPLHRSAASGSGEGTKGKAAH